MPIKRFVECLLPATACILKCSYCYVIQRNNRKMKQAELKYTPEQIARAMSQSRWGGERTSQSAVQVKQLYRMKLQILHIAF